MNWETIAEIAYTAYRAKLGTIWRSPPPGWLNLHQNEREAWRAAVEAAAVAFAALPTTHLIELMRAGMMEPRP